MKGNELDPSCREEPLIGLHQGLAILGHWLSAKPDGFRDSGKCLTGAGRSVEDEVHGGDRHGLLAAFAGVRGSICLKRRGGGFVEGNPEESLYVQPVLRLPLPVVAHDAEEHGEDVSEAAIIRCHVGRGFDEELPPPPRELLPGLVDPRDLDGSRLSGAHHGQRRKQDVEALSISQRYGASVLQGLERIERLRQGFFRVLAGPDQPTDD